MCMEIVGCRAEDSACPFRPPAMLFHGIAGGHIQGIMEEMERRSKTEARLAKGAQLNGRDAVRRAPRGAGAPRALEAEPRVPAARGARQGVGSPAADRRVGFLRAACLRGSEPVPFPPRKVSTPETPRSPPSAAALPGEAGEPGPRGGGVLFGRPRGRVSGPLGAPGVSAARFTAQASGPSGNPLALAWGLMQGPREPGRNERASSTSPDAQSSAPPKPAILRGSLEAPAAVRTALGAPGARACPEQGPLVNAEAQGP